MFRKACTAIMVIVFVEVDGIDVIEGGASRTVPRLDKIVSTIDSCLFSKSQSLLMKFLTYSPNYASEEDVLPSDFRFISLDWGKSWRACAMNYPE